MNPTQLANAILAQASATGEATWTKIETATRIYVKGYAQTLIETARAAVKGDITTADAKQYARNATFLLSQSISNMAHIALFQVQSFINGVINTVKTQINAALPIAIL